MKKLLYLLLFLPLFSKAQEKGIQFEKGLTWEQIKSKAKSENKYIFVDCFATWCGPCKAMDNLVYPTDTVGDFANEHYISVRIQMDTSKADNDEVKSWYADAHRLTTENKINAYPTFLFFSPDGKVTGKTIGAKNVKNFVLVLEQALKPEYQYYTMLDSFRNGNYPVDKMPDLAKMASDYNEKDISLIVARQYMMKVLDKLPEQEFCTKVNIGFIRSYYKMLGSGDRMFQLCYHKPSLVDTAMKLPGFAKSMVDYVINNEEVTPVINEAKEKNTNVDWQAISYHISAKYDQSYAERIVLNTKPVFYKYKKDWKNYTKYLVEKVEKTGFQAVSHDMWGANYINGNAWEIFLHSTDKRELEKALSWSERAIMTMPVNLRIVCIDTKANILYKLGRVKDAIQTEENAIKLGEDNAIKENKKPNLKEYHDVVEKMKKGESTWEDSK